MDSLCGLDILLAAVVLVSGIFALFRGFCGEMLGLGSWIVSGTCGVYLLPYVSPLTDKYISNSMISNAVAGIVSAIILLIVLTMLCSFLTGLVKKSTFNGIDHGLGFLFGCARGVLILVLVYFFFYLLAPQILDSVKKGSFLFPYLETLCMKTKDHLPESLFDNPITQMRKTKEEMEALKEVLGEDADVSEEELPEDLGEEFEEEFEEFEKTKKSKKKVKKKAKKKGKESLNAILNAINKDEIDMAMDEVKSLPKDDPLRQMLEQETKGKAKGRLGGLWAIIKQGRENMQKNRELFEKLNSPEIQAKEDNELYDENDQEDLNRLILENVEEMEGILP